MDQKEIEYFIEAALLAAARPLSLDQMQALFDGRSTPDKGVLRTAIAALNETYEARGIQVAEVASGFRMQVKPAMADRLQKLFEERPPRYSRALFETLALIAYRQPITRAEIEEVRGVSVSSNIMRSLVEREWVRVVGHRDVPGRPAMYGTTKAFLDYFSLKKLEDLPELADLSDWESLRVQLDLPDVDKDEDAEAAGEDVSAGSVAANEETADADAGDVTEAASADAAEAPEKQTSPEPAGTDLSSAEAEGATADTPDPAAIAPEANEALADADVSPEPDTEIPTLSADFDETGADGGPETDDQSSTEDEGEELVVSEWPKPDKSFATLQTAERSDDDRNNG